MDRSTLAALTPFTTLDGSTIREIAGVGGGASAPASAQSLAEATVPTGGETIAHLHRTSEELYFFTAGRGELALGDERVAVEAGECVVIPPGTVHQLWCTGEEPLVLLCCCSPPYTDEDTVLMS